MRERVLLIILDGWGYSDRDEGNAIVDANTKNMDKYMSKYLVGMLDASGKSVGLPNDVPGFCANSYQIIGTGKKQKWDHERILKDIEKGKYASKFDKVLKHQNIHVFSVLSNSEMYSHIILLKEFMKAVKKKRKKNVYIHLILGGVDSGPYSAYDLFNAWKDDMIVQHLASVVGKNHVLVGNVPSYVDKYISSLFSSEGEMFSSFSSAIMSGYDSGENDNNMNLKKIINVQPSSGDAFLILGYRSGKWLPLLNNLISKGYSVYHLSYPPKDGLNVIYKHKPITDGFVNQFVKAGGKLIKIGETERNMELTYFFTGGVDMGDSVIFPSPETGDYSVTPELRAPEITGEGLKRVKEGKYDLITVSFANPDVIAHTGNYDSLIAAIEIVDDGVGRLVRAAQKEGYIPVILGDHGNVEEIYVDGQFTSSSTLNPVPFIIASNKVRRTDKIKEGSLIDVPATLSKLFGKKFKLSGKSII